MHYYSNKSNARAAAKKLMALHDNLGLADPIFCEGEGWQAAVYVEMGVEAADVRKAAAVVTKPQAPADENTTASDEQKAKTPAPAPEPTPVKKAERAGTKKAKAIELMSRPNGVTAEALIKELDWQPHTLRGWVSLENKAGRGIVTVRKDGVTSYTISAK